MNEKKPQHSVRFVYYVATCFKALDHPSHDNVDEIIQRCPLFYMEYGIYNKPLLLYYSWSLEHAGGNPNKLTSKKNQYI